MALDLYPNISAQGFSHKNTNIKCKHDATQFQQIFWKAK